MSAMHSVLFIEDDENIRLALRLALEDEGYDVREAAEMKRNLERQAQLIGVQTNLNRRPARRK